MVRVNRITDLRMDGNKKLVKVFINGSFSFVVDAEVAVRAGLKVGQQLSVNRIEELTRASLSRRCSDAALRYLSYRPRSEDEVRRRLYRHGFDEDVVNETITDLKERKLNDDVAFAQFWKDNRLSFSPRSRRLIGLELKQKGVAIETADEVIGDIDDEISAYKAGVKKARVLAVLDYSEFRLRLSDYLRRRGFDYEVISTIVARLWSEQRIASI